MSRSPVMSWSVFWCLVCGDQQTVVYHEMTFCNQFNSINIFVEAIAPIFVTNYISLQFVWVFFQNYNNLPNLLMTITIPSFQIRDNSLLPFAMYSMLLFSYSVHSGHRNDANFQQKLKFSTLMTKFITWNTWNSLFLAYHR